MSDPQGALGRSNVPMNYDDPLARVASRPNVAELTTEFTEAVNFAEQDPSRAADGTRYALWDDQREDGRKYDREGKPAFPFNGACDTRIRMADGIVNDNVDALVSGFARSQVTSEGLEARDVNVAGAAAKALEWARNGGIPGLAAEVELAAQWGQHYGWSVLHTIWTRRISRRREPVDLETVKNLTANVESLAILPRAILDPATEQTASELLQQAYPLFVRLYSEAIRDDEIPELSDAQARKIVRELRAGTEAKVPIPYLTLNAPQIIALKPYQDVWFPPETTDLQRARVIFRVDWMTEAEIDAKVLTDGWNAEWATAVKLTAGKATAGIEPEGSDRDEVRVTGDLTRSRRTNLIQVLWAYQRQVDEDGVEQVTCTVFSPHVQSGRGQDYGKHEPLEYAHGLQPFTPYQRERTQRRLTSSRGVPEIVLTWQLEKKAQRDTLFDRTAFSIAPPLKVPMRNMGRTYRLRPMSQVAVSRADEVDWMDVPPGNPAEALELIREIGLDSNEYFGRISEGVDPVRANVKQQVMVGRFLDAWLSAFSQALALMQQFMTDAEWEEITGARAPERNFERIQRQPNWRLHYDVRDADTEYMTAKLKAFAQMLMPLDSVGVFDKASFLEMAAKWIDPSIASAVVQDRRGASQKLFTQVQNDFALMALGNDVQMVENDPTAGAQLQFAQQILTSNAKYQQLANQDQDFGKKVERWFLNRKQSVDQQQNKLVGRIGVQPAEA